MAWFGSDPALAHVNQRAVPKKPVAPLLGDNAPATSASRSAATAEALRAAARARRRAVGTLATSTPVDLSQLAPAVLTPKTLVGS